MHAALGHAASQQRDIALLETGALFGALQASTFLVLIDLYFPSFQSLRSKGHAGELINLVVASNPEHKLTPQQSCVSKFIKGDANDLLPPDMDHMPEPFILEEHLPKLLEGLDPDEEVGEVGEGEGVEWLPDVSLSHVGRKHFCNPYQVSSLQHASFLELLD
jgi:hypothetical protein